MSFQGSVASLTSVLCVCVATVTNLMGMLIVVSCCLCLTVVQPMSWVLHSCFFCSDDSALLRRHGRCVMYIQRGIVVEVFLS